MNTTQNLKSLSKTIKNKFTYGKISELFSKIVTDNSFLEKLTKIIGKKHTKTIKQNEADQIAAESLGFKDYNSAMGILSKRETLKLSDIKKIIDKLSDNSDYNNTLNSFNTLFKEKRNVFIKDVKDVIEEMEGQCEFTNEEGYTYCDDYLFFKNELSQYFPKKIIDITLESEYLGNNEYFVSYTLYFGVEEYFTLSFKLKTEENLAIVDYIFEDTIEVNQNNLTQYSDFCLSEQQDFFLEFGLELTKISYSNNVSKNNFISENDIKSLSTILFDYKNID